jgi:nicotinate dehydrogenase subunit B
MKRRDFLRTSSIVVVSFAFGSALPETAAPQDPAIGKPLDPREVDSFLAIRADGTVTIYTSKVDVGTGLSIAMTQMVAEVSNCDRLPRRRGRHS